jgi:hypothetical protein
MAHIAHLQACATQGSALSGVGGTGSGSGSSSSSSHCQTALPLRLNVLTATCLIVLPAHSPWLKGRSSCGVGWLQSLKAGLGLACPWPASCSCPLACPWPAVFMISAAHASSIAAFVLGRSGLSRRGSHCEVRRRRREDDGGLAGHDRHRPQCLPGSMRLWFCHDRSGTTSAGIRNREGHLSNIIQRVLPQQDSACAGLNAARSHFWRNPTMN